MSFGNRALGIMGMLGLSGMADQEEEQPVAPPQEGGSGMGMGLGNAITGISNSLFQGMSQEQVYRMGQGFNTLRFEPDDRMAANFETRINKIQDDKKTTDTTNATIDFLKKNKRDDLAEMVQNGIYSAAKAVDLAMTVTKDPEWLQKLNYAQKLMQTGEFGDIRDIPVYMRGILDIETEATPQFMQQLNALANPPRDEAGTVIPWNEQQLEVGFGIKKDDIPVFMAELNEMDALAELDPVKYTDEVILAMKMEKLQGKNISETNINMPALDGNAYADKATDSLYKKHETQVDGIDGLLADVRELHRLQDILDEGDAGKIKMGFLEPLYTKASQIAYGLGLTDGNQATKLQLLQSAFGGETFKMLKILGLGTKGIDTIPEREFLQSSFVGDTKMTVDQLQIMTQQRLDIITEAINVYNQRVNGKTEDGENSAYFKLYEQTFTVNLKPVEVPLRAGQKAVKINETVSKYF